MKTFAIFLVACVGLTCAQLSFSGSLGGSISALFGGDIANFGAIRAAFNAATSAAGKESILSALATVFLAKFKNNALLQGQNASEVISAFTENALELLNSPLPEWEVGLNNALMGLSKEKFQKILGTRAEANSTQGEGSNSIGSSRSKRQATTPPKSVDWRTKGAVSPVKNQGQCGSCWAFATVAAVESRIGVKTGKTPVLSEQDLVDCGKEINGTKCCKGCDGGWITDGYNHIQLKGINTEPVYPYEAKDGQCRHSKDAESRNTVSYEMVDQDDETDLMRAVAEGPVAVALDASGWSSYVSGIFRCRTSIIPGFLQQPLTINHGVLVVGYGTGLLTGDFWIVKNSWGDSWGEKGYIRIARNAKNQCGIAGQASYPLV